MPKKVSKNNTTGLTKKRYLGEDIVDRYGEWQTCYGR